MQCRREDRFPIAALIRQEPVLSSMLLVALNLGVGLLDIDGIVD